MRCIGKEKVTPHFSHLLISSHECQTVRESKTEYFVGDHWSGYPVERISLQLITTLQIQIHTYAEIH